MRRRFGKWRRVGGRRELLAIIAGLAILLLTIWWAGLLAGFA